MGREPELRPIEVAMTYVGAVIGAGFASGQEIMQFFTHLGRPGLLAALAAGFLFTATGAIIARTSSEWRLTSYQKFLAHILGPTAGRFYDLVITLFLGALLAVMISGSGAVFAEQLFYSYRMGVVIMVLGVFLILLFELRGVTDASTYVVPLMVTACALVAVAVLATTRPDLSKIPAFPVGLSFRRHWWLAGCLYVAHNLSISVVILSAMGGRISTPHRAARGGILGGIILAFLVFLLTAVTMGDYDDLAHLPLPMLHLAGHFGVYPRLIYGACLWLAMFTTAITSGYGLCSRVAQMTGWSPTAVLIAALATILPLSALGFEELVALFYPAIGGINLILLLLICTYPLRKFTKIGIIK